MDTQKTSQEGSEEEARRGEESERTMTRDFHALNDPPNPHNLNYKALLRKQDRFLLPTLTILYLLNWMDRGNIGNARLEGLEKDLNMAGNDYQIALTVFFFPYCAFEPIANVLLKKFRPRIWLPSIMVAWGIVMTLTGVVQNYHGLLAARFFLGLTECGLYPGVAYYLTNWYPRAELQYRQAFFFSAASMAGAFSGLLAYGIGFMGGVGGYNGWRWIFILEGLLTIIVALVAFRTLFDWPNSEKTFFTREEQEYANARLRADFGRRIDEEDEKLAKVDEFSWVHVKEAFSDWQIYLSILIYWGCVAPMYGISFFLPSIIKGLGYGKAESQLLTVPIYVFASVVSIVQAKLSDRYRKRYPFLLFSFGLMLIGFILAIAGNGGIAITLVGIFILATGIYPAFPAIVAWLANNLSGSSKRNIGMALQIGLGNMSGAMGSNFFRTQDAPGYRLGHGLEIGFIVMGITSTVVMAFTLKRINASRDRMLPEEVKAKHSEDELLELGDKSPFFRYQV